MGKNDLSIKQVSGVEKEITLIRPDGHPCVMRESRAAIALTRKGWKKYTKEEKEKVKKLRKSNLKKGMNTKEEIEKLKKKISSLETKETNK